MSASAIITSRVSPSLAMKMMRPCCFKLRGEIGQSNVVVDIRSACPLLKPEKLAVYLAFR